MQIAIRYHSRSGNTERIAQAIAGALDVPAWAVAQPLEHSADLLFVGGALYAGSIAKQLQRFLSGLTVSQAKQVVFFSTAVRPEGIAAAAKPFITDPHITVLPEAFHCRGRFLFFQRKHPDTQDRKDAADFALRIRAEAEAQLD